MEPYTGSDKKEWMTTMILCVIGFFGVAGIHRFYTGKIFTGFVWFFTGGLFLIGTIYDLVCILNGSYRTSKAEPLYR